MKSPTQDLSEIEKFSDFASRMKLFGITRKDALYQWELDSFKAMLEAEAKGVKIDTKKLESIILSSTGELKQQAEFLRSQVRSDDRAYTHINQTHLATGKIQTSSYNFLGMPAELREVVVPTEGFKFHAIQYEVPYLYTLASLSGEAYLTDALGFKGDISVVVSRVLSQQANLPSFGNVPFDIPTSPIIENYDTVRFLLDAIVYGSTDQDFADAAGIPLHKAISLMNKFYTAFPMIKEFQNLVIKGARESGKVYSYFGRQWIFDLSVKNLDGTIFNYVLQATVSDAVKYLIATVYNSIGETSGVSVVLPIEDGVLLEIPEGFSTTPMQSGIGELKIPVSETTGYSY